MRRVFGQVLLCVASVTCFVSWPTAQDSFFPEAMPHMEIPGLFGEPPFLPFVHGAEGAMMSYAPPEVTDPLFGDAVPHENQVLTCFHPRTPVAGDKFPTILFSSASVFRGFPPGTVAPSDAFLSEALRAGYAVISIGSTGITSDPTCSQPNRCSQPVSGFCGTAEPCWDSSLYYDPDLIGLPADGGPSPWNNFNYFYGEKDLTWARQYVAQHADTLFVDNDRVVMTGTSTGAHYAAFVAFRSEPWTAANFDDTPPGPLSPQVQQPTAIAGIVAFEPVAWLEGLPPEGSLPWSFIGAHWPVEPWSPTEATDYWQWAGWIQGVSPLETLRANSTSRWIREASASRQQTPVFLATGDGFTLLGPIPGTTGFGRNFNAPTVEGQEELDYERDGPTSSGDPKFHFATSEDEDRMWPHDAWQALTYRIDLDIVDTSLGIPFHAENSRLYIRDSLEWERFPSIFLEMGVPIPTPPFPPAPDPEDLLWVDGTYFADPRPDGQICPNPEPDFLVGSIDNYDIADDAIRWLDGLLRPEVAWRSAGANLDIYRASPARAGEVVEVTVDLSSLDPKYDTAAVIGYASPTPVGMPICNVFPPYCILVNLGDGNGELLSLGLIPQDANRIAKKSTVPVPRHPSWIGATLYTMACVYDVVVDDPPQAGVIITNAQDMTILPPLEPVLDVWINEIHYDSVTPDEGEFVELAGYGGLKVDGWTIYAYDGATREFYKTVAVSGNFPDQTGTDPTFVDGYGTLQFAVPGGLRDGPDGVALVDQGGYMIEFISYEGSFQATDGPATFFVSTNVMDCALMPVEETASTPSGHSLQRTGSGSTGADFCWLPPGTATPGAPNTGQIFE